MLFSKVAISSFHVMTGTPTLPYPPRDVYPGQITLDQLWASAQKVHFVRHWRHLFIAIVVIGVPYLVWDYFFIEMGVWGFNPDYLSGLYLTNLPLGELLFFVVVPFACMFIYECTKAYFPGLLFRRFNKITYALLSLYALFVLGQPSKLYKP